AAENFVFADGTAIVAGYPWLDVWSRDTLLALPGVFLARNQLERAQRSIRHLLRNMSRSEEHTSELQSREKLVCRLLLEKKTHDERRVGVGCLPQRPFCEERARADLQGGPRRGARRQGPRAPEGARARRVSDCPCGSLLPYEECCRVLHNGEPAPTAEALMRSRFAAFALGRDDYLLASWHPSTRPAALDLDPAVVWRRVQIVDSVAGGPHDVEVIGECRAW